MFIHWYPGHMTKALRMMEEEMKLVDSVIYVLDSRAPLSSVNPVFESLIGTKPRLYILNKADLVPQNEVNKWKSYFENTGCKCLLTNSAQKGGSAIIVKTLGEINAALIQRYINKGVNKTIRAMVIGIPNCGKSTLINSLIAKKKTVTGDKPGVTRGKQWVSIDKYIDLLDTPGTLYPDFSDQKKASNLAFIGSINDEVLDDTELCKELLKFLGENYSVELKNRYNLTEISTDFTENINAIGKRRGYILKGGEIDIEKTAKAVILDFRRQGFGKIILEKL